MMDAYQAIKIAIQQGYDYVVFTPITGNYFFCKSPNLSTVAGEWVELIGAGLLLDPVTKKTITIGSIQITAPFIVINLERDKDEF